MGTSDTSLCVAWLDTFADETAFIVELVYYQPPQEKFVYRVEQSATGFVFPVNDAPPPFTTVMACLPRSSLGVFVYAELKGARTLVGEMYRTVQCGDR